METMPVAKWESLSQYSLLHFRDCLIFVQTFTTYAPRPPLTQSEYFISFKKYFFAYWNKDSEIVFQSMSTK